ncbi:similar to Saccharomyces cerevisiae YGR009C SEC9 t-SNARE protein important for fusion of secretory vesicles with the plasma membrane [Maudiozyma saulgeensis]|uniref:Similar to Saccharomyces cerevisiae YGR009C SEC9 t-SNARE protein important for fusion of secretory vesicles with the plasma membrane n=1 Tax=Maudiozyma saulgeensis TaxID=1789683 RepID=A0A1X7RA08_9SACH|nr:similar to Saccharomyces cerevisiae YGR009C SEC9 t-SNARE protein important for fusion of secretory vesicles with the plasma membrane [Kazachstania saulgeensis]
MKVHVKSFLAKRGVRPPEEETLEQNRTTLSNAGFTVKDPSRNRKEKFSAYGQFARDKNPHKFYAPPGYEDVALQQQQKEKDARQQAQDERDANEQAKRDAAKLKEEKKQEKKKRGLFGRKKSNKDDDDDTESSSSTTAATYDPYAAVTNPTSQPSDPYGMRGSSNLNEYNNTMRQPTSRASSMDPHNSVNGASQPMDPYGSSSRTRDPYSGSSLQNADPYGSSQSRDPYGSSQNVNAYGVSKSTSPYDSTQNSDPYGAPQNRNPYTNTEPSSNGRSQTPSSNNNNNSYSMNNDPYSSYTTNNGDSYGKTPYQNNNGATSSGLVNNSYNRAPQADPSDDLNFSNTGSVAGTSPYKESRSPMYSRNNTPDVSPSYGGPIASSTRDERAPRGSELKNYNSYTIPSDTRQPKTPTPSGSNNPYASLRNDSYNTTGTNSSSNPYGSMNNGANYNTRKSSNPYANTPVTAPTSRIKAPLHRTPTNLTTDLNRTSTLNATPSIMGGVSSGGIDLNDTINEYGDESSANDLNADVGQREQQQLQQIDELNATDDQRTQYDGYNRADAFDNYQNQSQQLYNDDLNAEVDTDRGYKTFEEIQHEEEQRQQQEEDDAVDELKQQIKFTKQSSVASTRNTLKMAQEAEMSGMNTLGLLGHQSEKLNNVERNLDLMNIQNSIADEKVTELQKLNRSLWAVHVSNPFNSKRRKQEREEKIKNQKIQEQAMMNSTNQELTASQNRIENAMDENGRNISDIRDRYERKDILGRAQKYQFENDEEDDEMEIEIDRNLDKIQQVSGRLKKLALAAGSELESQQDRIKRIEDNTDDLDIKIHVNTTKLSTIK